MTLDDQTRLALGGFTTELLSDETFKLLIAMYSQQCAADILNTKPEDKAEREGFYYAYQGFEGFLALAKKFAEDFQREQDPKIADTPDVDDDDPSVHNIYDGLPN